MRFELTTPTLARLCSTPELRPLERLRRVAAARCIWRKVFSIATINAALGSWIFHTPVGRRPALMTAHLSAVRGLIGRKDCSTHFRCADLLHAVRHDVAGAQAVIQNLGNR